MQVKLVRLHTEEAAPFPEFMGLEIENLTPSAVAVIEETKDVVLLCVEGGSIFRVTLSAQDIRAINDAVALCKN